MTEMADWWAGLTDEQRDAWLTCLSAPIVHPALESTLPEGRGPKRFGGWVYMGSGSIGGRATDNWGIHMRSELRAFLGEEFDRRQAEE
jgi:hypothetical protein